jgi:acyl-CoA thioester hydrolase
LLLQCKKIYLRLQDKSFLQYISDNSMTLEKRENYNTVYPGFRHHTAIQVRFKDLDSLGHVNNANHLTYLELARMNYFRDVVTANNDWSKKGFILAKITIDYLQPILLEDDVRVFTRCSRTGNKSFDLEYEMVKNEKGSFIPLAKGHTVLVCYNYEENHSIALNPAWIEKMQAFENN